jgi:hypothetical protein
MGNIKTANQSDKRTSDDMMMQGFTKNFKGAGVNKQTSLKYEHPRTVQFNRSLHH